MLCGYVFVLVPAKLAEVSCLRRQKDELSYSINNISGAMFQKSLRRCTSLGLWEPLAFKPCATYCNLPVTGLC
jgi:hypothetical protein